MSDERLKDIRESVEDASLPPWIDRAFDELFAEIDRLQAQVSEYADHKAMLNTCIDGLKGRVEALQAQAKSLELMREFIEGIAISCGKEDEDLARELLARVDAGGEE